MGYDITIKRGDTRNAIKAILKDAFGTPVNLAGCSVSFHMSPLGLRQSAVASRAVHVQDTANGEVWFLWAPGETDTAGVYRAEFAVIYPDGRRETFPNTSYISIRILDDLG